VAVVVAPPYLACISTRRLSIVGRAMAVGGMGRAGALFAVEAGQVG
jgi:hypothetical protein